MGKGVSCAVALAAVMSLPAVAVAEPEAAAEPGPHYRQAAEHPAGATAWTAAGELPSVTPQARASRLARRVYGYLPYWTPMGAIGKLRWDLLTDVLHFSAELNGNGGITDSRGFIPSGASTAPIADLARKHGVRAHLCTTFFGSGLAGFLGNANARKTAITNLVALAKRGGVQGLNIDFEFVQAGSKAAFVAFIQDAARELHAAIPGSELTIAMPAHPPWYPGYDVPALAAAADRLLIMGYDYHYRGGSEAGPVAPLEGGMKWTVTVETSVAAPKGYLDLAPAGKLALGVPYYGYDWPTRSASAVPTQTTGSAKAVLYKDAVGQAASNGRKWDPESKTPWYGYGSSAPHQTWYEDAESLSAKYDFINQKNLAGIMIWALGYDDGHDALWRAMEMKLAAGVVDGGASDDAAAEDGSSDGSSDADPEAGEPSPDTGATGSEAGSRDGAALDAAASSDTAADRSTGATDALSVDRSSSDTTGSLPPGGDGGGCDCRIGTNGEPSTGLSISFVVLVALLLARRPRGGGSPIMRWRGAACAAALLGTAGSLLGCGETPEWRPSGVGALHEDLEDPVSISGDGPSLDDDQVSVTQPPVGGPAHGARAAADEPRVFFLWYATGGEPPSKSICTATPPAFRCNFGGAEGVRGCQKAIQTHLNNFYKDLNVIFTFNQPTCGNYYTEIISQGGGAWCGRTADGSAPIRSDCGDFNGGTAYTFSCESAKLCAAVIAQEQAHLVGLQHTTSPTDLMNPNITKSTSFEDKVNTTVSPFCGQPTQNTWQLMKERLGLWPAGAAKPDPFAAGGPDAACPGPDAGPDAGADLASPDAGGTGGSSGSGGSAGQAGTGGGSGGSGGGGASGGNGGASGAGGDPDGGSGGSGGGSSGAAGAGGGSGGGASPKPTVGGGGCATAGHHPAQSSAASAVAVWLLFAFSRRRLRGPISTPLG